MAFRVDEDRTTGFPNTYMQTAPNGALSSSWKNMSYFEHAFELAFSNYSYLIMIEIQNYKLTFLFATIDKCIFQTNMHFADQQS